jgi:hypothetical protein
VPRSPGPAASNSYHPKSRCETCSLPGRTTSRSPMARPRSPGRRRPRHQTEATATYLRSFTQWRSRRHPRGCPPLHCPGTRLCRGHAVTHISFGLPKRWLDEAFESQSEPLQSLYGLGQRRKPQMHSGKHESPKQQSDCGRYACQQGRPNGVAEHRYKRDAEERCCRLRALYPASVRARSVRVTLQQAFLPFPRP